MTTYPTTYLALLNGALTLTRSNHDGPTAPFEEAIQRATVDELRRALAKLKREPYKSYSEIRQARIRKRIEELIKLGKQDDASRGGEEVTT